MNTVIRYTVTLSGSTHDEVFNKYLMQPDAEEMYAEVRAFDRGSRRAVQEIVQVAYWHFLREFATEIESALLPLIPYKFDRKHKTATITLCDGDSIKITSVSGE